jgi:REP element-mobilizing transposase RayT
MKQFKLFKEKTNLSFGGSELKGRRKSARPLDSKRPTHIILKATNPYHLLRHRRIVNETIEQCSRKFGVRVYESAVQADHIHLGVKIPSRFLYRAWIRALTSILVRKVVGLKWHLRPYTKIGSWGRQFNTLIQYIRANQECGDFIFQAHECADDWLAKTSPSGLEDFLDCTG